MVFQSFTISCRPGPRWAVGGTLALAAALGLSAPAAQAQVVPHGLDLALTAGSGKYHVHKYGLVLGWTRPGPLWQGTQWRLMLRHEGELAQWRVPDAPNVLELGYSPVLRFERPLAGSGTVFFLEGSIGVRLLSRTRVAGNELSTAFQFSDQLGLGWQWGEQGRHTLGLRLQHLSNASIKEPNPGMNFWQLVYRYRF